MNGAAEEAYWNLVAAARAEGGIGTAEREVLQAFALKLGLEPSRAKEIEAAAEAETPPRIRIPKDTKERLDTLRAILEVVAADGAISPKELSVARALSDRLSIRGPAFDVLMKAALRSSKDALDRAFARMKVRGIETSEDVVFAGPLPEPPRAREALRSMPFAARLAPPTRNCEDCGFSFGERNVCSRYCRACYGKRGIREMPAGRIELLYGLLFLILFSLSAFLVQKTTGLWSWAFDAMRGLSQRGGGRGRSQAHMFLPLGLTVILAWLGTWGGWILVRRLGGRRVQVSKDP